MEPLSQNCSRTLWSLKLPAVMKRVSALLHPEDSECRSCVCVGGVGVGAPVSSSLMWDLRFQARDGTEAAGVPGITFHRRTELLSGN